MYKLIAFFACLALASSTDFNQCDDGSMAPLAVRVSGCDTLPCEIVLGTNVKIEADGVALRELDNLLISVISIRPDGTITTVPIPDINACNLIVNGTCPVAPGTAITIASALVANPIFPPGETTLEVRMLMGAETLICFAAPIVLLE